MNRLAALVFIVSVAGFTGCAIESGLPFASATVGPGNLAAVGERVEAASCRQELGIDAGDQVETAHTIELGAVDGCLVEGDEADGFIVDVPGDAGSYTYTFRVRPRNENVSVRIIDTDGGTLASGGASRLETWKRTLEIAGGTRLLVSIESLWNPVPYTLEISAERGPIASY